MNFYYVKDSYIDYLRTFDEKVPENKNESRPYIGIVLEIGDIKYYAPFTSPKPKHKKMRNGKDFRKIAGGKLGAINFNNMIPVVDSALIPIKMKEIQDTKYRLLLQNQYEAILTDTEEIKRTATELRMLVLTPDENLSAHSLKIKSRCCCLSILEKASVNYFL